jgi:hypothetical protein
MTRTATSRFSFAIRFVYALLSTTVVYSSGPVTALMQKQPPGRSEKKPSSIHSRAGSTSTSAPWSSMKPSSTTSRSTSPVGPMGVVVVVVEEVAIHAGQLEAWPAFEHRGTTLVLHLKSPRSARSATRATSTR